MTGKKASKLDAYMDRLGVRRDGDVRFGRPYATEGGAPVSVIADSFAAGESIPDLARDYGMSESGVLDAIRFVLLYPKCDLPSFWKGRE